MAAYTSSDEFDLERRVWMTNETPVYDIYKALNSSMQTPFWKWFLGTSKVDYNLPYRVYSGNANGYVHDEDSDEVYLKMTNGQISSNYGPDVSSVESDKNFNPTYNRIEIDGVVLPEFDLMLHEVYRYLETIYPDHPNERKLLTDNEFNDTILAAADMINYNPDVKFFDKVAETVSNTLTVDEANEEAAKIKIRNLLNNAFRRKLYGSKAGYRMFANDIFQLCTIFPVATYIPIVPVEKTLLEKEANTLNSKAALDAFNMTKDEYLKYSRKNNRTIDTYSELYYRKFRLTDWDGQNSSYLQKADENTYLFGYSIPCNENRIYEYPNASDTDSVLDDVAVGSVISNKLDDKGITYITDLSDDVFQIETSADISLSSGKPISATISTSNTEEVHYVTTSHNNAIVYQNAKLYLPIKEIFTRIENIYKKHSDNPTDLFTIINNTLYTHYADTSSSTNNFITSIYKAIENSAQKYKEEIFESIKPENINIINNPYVAGSILLEPSKSISYYNSDIPSYSYVYNNDGNLTDEIIFNNDTITDANELFEKYIGDVDLTESSFLNYLYILNGFTKGTITYNFNSTTAVALKEKPEIKSDSRYGFVINTNNGDRVVVFGKLDLSYTLNSNNMYVPTKAVLSITHIPNKKPDSLLNKVYSDYSSIISAKALVEEDISKKYTIAGLTENGCKDLVSLFNAKISDYIEVNSIEGLEAKKLYKYNENYYYITWNGITVDLGASFTTDENVIISAYKQATGQNYIDYVNDYLELQIYNSTLDSYRKNVEYMTEVSSYTTDQESDDEIEFEASTIRPGNTVEKIIVISDLDGERIFGDTSFKDGTISEYSLGNLSIYPIINNGTEYITVCSPDDQKSDYIESNCDTYSYSNNVILHWPSYKFFYGNGNKHATSDSIVNNNSQLYTFIPEDISSDNKTAGEWLANCKWYDTGDIDNNITISPVSTTEVEIEGVIDLTNEGLENTITFTDETSIERFKTLSIGDTVYGPTINSDDNDVYITSIGYNSVTVSQSFNQSGTFKFTFNCKLNTVIDEADDMMQYKDRLDSYGEYSIINPFDHGLWGSSDYPYVSNAILESLPDISFYKPYNYITENSSETTINSFYEVMKKLHPITADKGVKVIPSTIKFMNDLFVELNITKVLSTTTRSGSTKALMSVDWLDYISNSLNEISRATDKTNVGVNLMMETDCSGYYTMSSTLNYTDPNIQLKFITMNFKGIQPMWNNYPINSTSDWTVPAYAQIGTGGSGRYSWFTSPADVTYPNIWGNNVFDSTNITDSEVTTLEKNNGRLRKRSTWGKEDNEEIVETGSDTRYQSVEKPLFEIPLGEYDIQTRYLPSGVSNINLACTTIQSSFYAQTFNNLTKYITMDDTDNDISPILLKKNSSFEVAPIKKFGDVETLNYLGAWTPSLVEGLDKTKSISSPSFQSIGQYYTIDKDTIVADSALKIGDELVNSKKFNNHSIYIKIDDTSEILYETEFIGIVSTDTILGCMDLKYNLVYSMLYAMGISVADINDIKNSNTYGIAEKYAKIPDIINNILTNEIDKIDLNKIYWFISNDELKFEDISLKKGDIVGIATPYGTANSDVEAYKYVIFNKGYFTETLPMSCPKTMDITKFKVIIENNDLNPLVDLSKNVTTIKLPRKCITEGSYNFDYIIDAGITCTGYLYGTSVSNGVSYNKDADDLKEYDSIENDNFDIVTDDEVTFNITRGAIYKDEDNDEFYVFTDKYKKSGDTIFTECQDNLAKVAIKFEEQKYFKNTTYLTGTYKTVKSLTSGSSDEVVTPTLYQLNDSGEFNTTLISPNDRILRIASMDLRSIYNSYLEPILFSNYYDISGMVRGIDKNNNLVVSYDNTLGSPSEKLSFITSLKNIVPVDKEYNSDTGSYIITPKDDNYFDFESSTTYNAPIIYSDSVKFTKSIISDNRATAASDYEFKYFKNLLVLKASINANNPNKIVPASSDEGQFNKAIQYIQSGDKVVSGLCLTTTGNENTSDISVNYNGKSILGDAIKFAYYNTNSKSFICATSTQIGLALNVNLPNDTVISLDYYGEPKHKVSNEEKSFDSILITDVSYDDTSWLITINQSGNSLLYSLPLEAESLVLSEAYSEYKDYPDEEATVPLLSESREVKADNTISYEAAYAKASDLSIQSKSDDAYYIKPYAINYNSTHNTEDTRKFYKVDPKNGWAVYCSGRDTFIKSPVYITDNNGTYTDQVSSNNYWKYARIPLLNETNYSIYQNIISARTVTYGYERSESIRNSILALTSSFDALFNNVSKNESGKYTYTRPDTKMPLEEDELPTTDNAENASVIKALTELSTNYGINSSDNSLTEVIEQYYAYYCILKNLKTMPWNSPSSDIGETISSFITTVLDSNTTKYYYYNISRSKFEIANDAPTLSDYSNYVEYLEGRDEDGNCAITYHGIGPYSPAKEVTTASDTTTITSDTVDNIYGCDMTFSSTMSFTSKSSADSNWYAEYLSNLTTYGFMDDQTTAVCTGNIKDVIFTTDNIVFITTGGSIIYIAKEDTYKADSLSNANNWHTTSLPNGLFYDYIKKSSSIVKTIKYGENKTFDLQSNIALAYNPIYNIDSIHSHDNTIVIGGYIKSRKDIESEWKSLMSNMGYTSSDDEYNTGLTNLTYCVPNAKFFYSNTPFVLYSDNGGETLSFGEISDDLPDFEINSSSTPAILSKKDTNGDAVKITDSTIYSNSTCSTLLTKLSTIITTAGDNDANIRVYDKIHYVASKEKYYLDSAQGNGLTIAGISYEAPNVYRLYLTKTDSNNTEYSYMLKPTVGSDDIADFDNIQVYDKDADLKSIATSYKVSYNTFTLFVNPDLYSIKVSSTYALNFNYPVTGVGNSDITFANDIISSKNTSGTIDVLVSFETRTGLSILEQKACINTKYLSDYFDITNGTNECLVSYIKAVSDSGSADILYSLQEASLENTTEGYPSLAQDKAGNHIFYDYNTVSNASGDTIYIEKEFDNASGSPIYLCNIDGDYINKTSNTITAFNLYQVCMSSSFDSSLLTKAALPKYTSVDEAVGDSSLRTEDENWKKYFNISKVSSINADDNFVPYTYSFAKTNGIETIKSGNFIIKTADGLEVSTTAPSIVDKDDLATFDINTILSSTSNDSNSQIKYTGDTYTIRNNAYIVKGNDKFTIICNPQVSGGDTSVFDSAINIAKGTYSKYIGEAKTIENGSYITCDNVGTIGFTKDSPLVNNADISEFNLNDFISIETGHFAKYAGESTLISGYIINKDGVYTVTTVEPTSEENITNGGEKEFSLGSLPNSNSYIKIKEPYTIAKNSYILHTSEGYSITEVDQMYSAEDISTFSLDMIYSMSPNTYVKYVGENFTINKNSYIIHDEKSYIDTIDNYSSYSRQTDMDSFSLSTIATLDNNQYMQYIGNDIIIATDSYIMKFDNVIYISDKPKKNKSSYISIKELSNYDVGSYLEYTGNDFSIIEKSIKLKYSTNTDSEDISIGTLLYTSSDKDKLEQETGYLDSLDSTIPSVSFENRFSLVKLDDAEYYYDNYLGYFPINIIRYISLKANIGYNVNQSQTYYTQKDMHDISDTDNEAMPNAITGIYIPQKGYGGSRLRTEQDNSWCDELPWEIDEAAFDSYHITNKYGEKIKLYDSDGVEIIADRGEFPANIGDTLTVPTDLLGTGNSFDVSLSTFDEQNHLSQKVSSVTVYRPADSTKYLWSTQNTVYINIDATANTKQSLLGLYEVNPSKFTLDEIDGTKATIEYSFDNATFTATSGVYTFEGNTLEYITPNSIEIIQPSYLKITYNGNSIIIKLSYSSLSNKTYDSITPAFYTYINNTYSIINKNKLYKLDTEEKLSDNTTGFDSSATDESGIVFNLPIFRIDTPKTYFMYDPTYTGGLTNASISWIKNLRKECFIGNAHIDSNKISCTVSGSTSEVTITCTYNDDNYNFIFDINTIIQPTSSDVYLSLTDDSSFVTTSNDPIKLTIKSANSTTIDNLYVTGARGPIYMRYPIYGTFKDLISNEQYIIKSSKNLYNASSIKNGTDALTSVTFNNIETNNVTFTDVLPVSSLNDGNSHFIRIEVLTQKTVPTTKLNMHSNDYESVDLSDINIFPPDRVYFNPKGYPSSPVIINNKIYNKDNNIYYTDSLFTNNNNKAIRECDSTGKFIKYVISNGEAVKTAITLSDSTDNLFTPNKPNYNSCKDWFEGEFYVSGQESNPFWQVINLTSKFNSVNQVWTQQLSLNKFEKAGRTIKQVSVDDSEAYLTLDKGSYYEEFDGDLKQYYNCDYLNLFDGVIRFIAKEPTSSIYNVDSEDNEQIIKYGICANNTVKDNFHEDRTIPGYLQSSYTVNSHKNYANPNETDSAIVEITEMGLFNKAHVLIAYAVFPPIEYRSDTQHVSFTSFIKYGNCTMSE